MFHLIDRDHWDRRSYFEHYSSVNPCTYSITAELDITELLREVRVRGIRLYPALIHIAVTVVNRHREFRLAYDAQGRLGYWDHLVPNYTVFHSETGTFSTIWTDCIGAFPDFLSAYDSDTAQYGGTGLLTPKPDEPDNVLNISSIPWVRFTGMDLQIHNGGSWFIPILTFGKYSERSGSIQIPLSVRAHHAACDGYHIGLLYQEMQDLASECAGWIDGGDNT